VVHEQPRASSTRANARKPNRDGIDAVSNRDGIDAVSSALGGCY
jgi:myo-inositol-hexaphosphate 3-phosphohydrolase